jgi:hypothetical protein
MSLCLYAICTYQNIPPFFGSRRIVSHGERKCRFEAKQRGLRTANAGRFIERRGVALPGAS